ncbi:MAG TPA: hypothetical protein VFA73_03215 [Actinomycetota bacterium]|nr:hypothetical protein [Actinomycetota bacterium]
MKKPSSPTWAAAPASGTRLPARSGATARATVAQTKASATGTRQAPSRGTISRSTTATKVMAAQPPTHTGVSTK